MKFVLSAGKMMLEPAENTIYTLTATAPQVQVSGGIMGWLNDVSDSFIQSEVNFILKPIGHFLLEIWHWVVDNLPDIIGFYGTLVTAVCIILSSMLGRGGIIKPITVYAGLLILSICILGGRHSA